MKKQWAMRCWYMTRLLIPLLGVFCMVSAAWGLPGAVGFGELTQGGRGGTILRVTNLNAQGPGSLAAALAGKGRRVVVFEVGGVIDLKGKTLRIEQPFVTVAGQTAPSLGITLIRGGLTVEANVVFVQHLRVRPGSAGRKKGSGWEVDGIGMNGATRVIIDHCSVSWSTDENLSASGPRFTGKDVSDWRRGTSREVTISNCIIAEGLAHSTHGKGEHSKGTLLHDNATQLVVVGNLYACNVERNPLAKGGVQAVIVNNWISNPGRRAVHHALNKKEWKGKALQTSRLAVVGNVLEHGQDTQGDVALFENHEGSPLQLFMADNLSYDRKNEKRALLKGEAGKLLEEPPLWPDRFKASAAGRVRERVAQEAGARPWDRDEVDERIVKQALERRGKIIDGEDEVGGYPKMKSTQRAFDEGEWDLRTMSRKAE